MSRYTTDEHEARRIAIQMIIDGIGEDGYIPASPAIAQNFQCNIETAVLARYIFIHPIYKGENA